MERAKAQRCHEIDGCLLCSLDRKSLCRVEHFARLRVVDERMGMAFVLLDDEAQALELGLITLDVFVRRSQNGNYRMPDTASEATAQTLMSPR